MRSSGTRRSSATVFGHAVHRGNGVRPCSRVTFACHVLNVGQLRTPPKARDYRKLHLAVDEHTSDVVASLTSKRARDASRVASLVGQIERPIASAKAAYDTGDV